MSSYDPAFADIFYVFRVQEYCITVAAVVYVYDVLLTFDAEVEFFWKDSFTGATALFLMNRYFLLAMSIFQFFQLRYMSDKSCFLYQRTGIALISLQFIPEAVFSCLRAYALSRNWPLAVLILGLGVVPLGVNIADFGFHLSGTEDPIFGCLLTDTESLSTSVNFTIAARTCLIIADILVVLITWRRLYRKQMFSEESRPLTFERVLVQNGTFCFIILLFMNILHLSLSILSISGSSGGYSAVTAFTPVVTGILISRFFLDLQRAKRKQNNIHNTGQATITFSDSAAFESVNFASRVIQSLGETLAIDTEIEMEMENTETE